MVDTTAGATIASCGTERVLARVALPEISADIVRINAQTFFKTVLHTDTPVELREAKLDDGTPCWISTASGTIPDVDGSLDLKGQRHLVFIGVKLPDGKGVFLSGLGIDASSVMRDANAMWTSPPAGEPSK